MTISIKHKFVNPKSDTADTTVSRASNWNDEHDITLAQNRVLGRVSAANGPVEELTGEQIRAMSDVTQAGVLVGINTRTASYTLVASDRGKIVEMNVASANTVTIPNEAGIGGVNYPIGTQIKIAQLGTGQTTLLPAAGVTARSVTGGLSTSTRYGALILYKRASNDWFVIDQTSAYLDGRIDTLETIAGGIANVGTVAANMADINTVASDLNEPVSEINTVAVNIANVNTVGTNIANVNTAATNIGNVNTVGANIASVNLNTSNMAAIQGASANAISALASANAAANSATAAASSATNAVSSASTAVAAAQSSGNIVFYDTKSLANAGLAGLSANQVIEVFNDESLSGQRTRYRKESGVYVFKMYLPKGIDVYVDSNAANDSADGFGPTTPKKTLAGALALLSPGSTLNLARGSRWFERLLLVTRDIKIRAYKNGNRPIIDGSLLVSGSWTQHATYTNLWYIDVTFAESTFGTYPASAVGGWHPALFDESTSTRPEEAYVSRVLNNDVVAGSTVSQTTIDGLLTIANANAGTFTVHRTGSTNYEPRNDNGTTFRFYLYPADGSNPNTNGRNVYVVGQTITAYFGANNSVHDLVIQRTGAKDLVNMEYSSDITLSDFTRVDFLDAAIHATVVGGTEFRNCRAIACAHGDSRKQGGGAYHQYTEVPTKGFKIFDCEARGFFIAVYSHPGAGSYTEHETFDADGLTIFNCHTAFYTGSVAKGVRARRVVARDIEVILDTYATGGAIFEDSKFLNVNTSVSNILKKNFNLTFRRCYIYKDPASSRLLLIQNDLMGTILASEYPTVVLESSTIVGNINTPGNTTRQQINLRLTNSILHQVAATEDNGIWPLGTIIATNSFIGTTSLTLPMLQTQKVGVDSSCLTQVVRQVFEKTIAGSDIAYYASARFGTYSGTPNVDGTASIVLNYNDADTWSRSVRLVDAYGAGLHYSGFIVSQGTAGASQAITVYPAPTSAFTSKVFANGAINFQIFGSAMEVAGTIDWDGLKISVPDGSFFTSGMYINVGAPSARQKAFGARKITAVSGNILTLNQACPWIDQVSGVEGWYNKLGSITNRARLPTVPITFGFPLIGKNNNVAGITYPKLTITPLTPTGVGSPVTFVQTYNVGRFVYSASSLTIGMGSKSFDYNADGTTDGWGFSDQINGDIYQAFGVAVGDVMRFEISAIIDEYAPQFSNDPLSSGGANLQAGSLLARLKMGYQQQAWGA